MTLSFATLRKANTLRLPQFKNSRGGPAHSEPDGSDWSKGEWMNAILGELGEAANLVKKVKRGDMPLDDARELLAYELADVVTYTDLTAMQCGSNFEIFNDFDFFRSTNEAFFQAFPETSLGEWMTRAFKYYGSIATMVDNTGGNFSGVVGVFPALRNYFNNALTAIDCAAMKIDADLGVAVLKKFNHVSTRVKANVYIVENRVIDIYGTEL